MTSEGHVTFRDEFGRYDIVNQMGRSVLPPGVECYAIVNMEHPEYNGLVAVRINFMGDAMWKFLDVNTGAITEDCFSGFAVCKDSEAGKVVATVEKDGKQNFCTFDVDECCFGYLSENWFHKVTNFINGTAIVEQLGTHATSIIDEDGCPVKGVVVSMC